MTPFCVPFNVIFTVYCREFSINASIVKKPLQHRTVVLPTNEKCIGRGVRFINVVIVEQCALNQESNDTRERTSLSSSVLIPDVNASLNLKRYLSKVTFAGLGLNRWRGLHYLFTLSTGAESHRIYCVQDIYGLLIHYMALKY